MLVAILGPLLVRAVNQSTLAAALADGRLSGTSLTVSADVDAGQSYEVAQQPVLDSMTALTTGDAARLWQRPVTVIRSSSIVIWKANADATGIEAQVNAVEQDCAGYVIIEGECPTGKGQVMIISFDTERQQVRVQDRITVTLAKSAPISLTVVGIYDPVARPSRRVWSGPAPPRACWPASRAIRWWWLQGRRGSARSGVDAATWHTG